MVDNFKLLSNIIENNDASLTEDNFYFLQLIRRSKDTEGLPSKTFKDIYVKNSQDLLSRKSEIIELCDFYNARAYFNPNVKSYEKCANYMLKAMGDMYTNKSFNQAKGMFSSAAGQISTRDPRFKKVWIIDYDNDEGQTSSNQIIDFLCCDGGAFHMIPTKNGTHFLTEPFRTDTCPFADKIQKHNPTILYVKG